MSNKEKKEILIEILEERQASLLKYQANLAQKQKQRFGQVLTSTYELEASAYSLCEIIDCIKLDLITISEVEKDYLYPSERKIFAKKCNSAVVKL